MSLFLRPGVWLLLLGALLSWVPVLSGVEQRPWDPVAAKRIQSLMRALRVRADGRPQLRSVRLTEHEVNSYLNLIYRQRYFPALKEIRLRFLPPDKVAGKFRLKLERDGMMGAFFSDGLVSASFAGRLETDAHRIRFQFEHLDINGRSMDLGLLDSVFQTVQTKRKGVGLRSIGDWFRLLPGTRGLEMGRGFHQLYL